MDRLNIHFRLDSALLLKRVFWGLLALEICIVLLDLLITYGRFFEHHSLRGLVNITREDSVGTWFACLQAFLVGAAYISVAGAIHFSKASDPIWKRLFWLFMGLFFIYVSFDDGSKFHERMGQVFGDSWPSSEELEAAGVVTNFVESFPTYYWHIVFMPIFIVIGSLIFAFLWKELNSFKLRFMLLAAMTCYVVSQGLDATEKMEVIQIFLQNAMSATEYTILHCSKVIEEFLEMFGTTLFLMIALRYLLDRLDTLECTVIRKESKEPN